MDRDQSSEDSARAKWFALDDSLVRAQAEQLRIAFCSFINGMTNRIRVLVVALLFALPISLLADPFLAAHRAALWVVIATPLLLLGIAARTAFEVLPLMGVGMFKMKHSHQVATQIVEENVRSSTPFILYLRGFSTERFSRVPSWRRALALLMLAIRLRPQFVHEPTDLPGAAIGNLAVRSTWSQGTLEVLMLRNPGYPHVWTESVPALSVTDLLWRDAVRFLAIRSSAIVLLLDEVSEGLLWEIDLIISLQVQRKTIVLFPEFLPPDEAVLLDRLAVPSDNLICFRRGMTGNMLSVMISWKARAVLQE